MATVLAESDARADESGRAAPPTSRFARASRPDIEWIHTAPNERPPYPEELFDNPIRYENLATAYTSQNIVAIMLVLGGLQLVAHAVEYATHHQLTGLGLAGAAMLAGLLVAQTAVMVWTGNALHARRRARFYFFAAVQNVIQLLWFQLLCAVSHPAFLVVGLLALCAWTFNDIRLFHDHKMLRWQYTLPFAVFDLAVLAGVRGAHLTVPQSALLAEYTSPTFYAVQLGVVGILLAIIMLAGRQAKQYDMRVFEMTHVERQLALLRKEREIVERACRLMTTGLQVSKFSHDVASPLTVLTLNVSFLRELVEREARVAPSDDDARWRRLRNVINEVEVARRQLQQLAEGMVRAVKEQSPLRRYPVRQLVDDAWREAVATLKGHGTAGLQPKVALAEASLVLTEGHTTTVANILVNGVLQVSDAPLEVTGALVNRYFYRLSIRDHGVSEEARDEALARIESAMALSGSDEAPRDAEVTPRTDGRGYRGYGLALMMAKVLLVRHNGWISARAPDSGPGVVFDLVIPAVVPSEIPPDANHPELV